MAKPLVAVVGRPNVGKSTFFNRVCGKRLSIVADEPGVTRDRIYADADWAGRYFTMVDTGGIELKSGDEMLLNIRIQAQIAMETADVILFMCDGKEGITSGDHDAAEMLRSCGKPVVLAVNKLDNMQTDTLYDFYELGLGDPVPVSCEQAKGIGDLLDEIVNRFPAGAGLEEGGGAVRIAVAGKPNAGKSSLVNRLLGFDRVIVSDVAGTTRDAIDTPFRYNGKDYVLVDTAGLRRKRSVEEDTVESYAVMRALNAVRTSDFVLVVIDVTEPISEQDIKIAAYACEQGKPALFVMNKWDAVEKDTFTIEKYRADLKAAFVFMPYFCEIFISAKTGMRADKIMPMVEEIYERAGTRITTGTLNDLISDAVSASEPPFKKGKRVKIRYAAQTGVHPPEFVLFVNDAALMPADYKRYLENSLRKSVDFSGTPLRIVLRSAAEEK